MSGRLRGVQIDQSDFDNFMQIANQFKSMNHRMDELERMIVKTAYEIQRLGLYGNPQLAPLVAEAMRIEAAQRVTPKKAE